MLPSITARRSVVVKCVHRPIRLARSLSLAMVWLFYASLSFASGTEQGRGVSVASTSSDVSSLHVVTRGIVRTANEMHLRMRVWNCGKEPLTTDVVNLPWSIHMTTLLWANVGVADNVKTALPLIGDPASKDVVIPARGYIDGFIHLEWYFPGIEKDKELYGVVILWAYDLASLTRQASDADAYEKSKSPAGGMVILREGKGPEPKNPCL